jgi:importin-7
MRLMQENEKEQAQDDDDDGETVTSKILAALGILNTLGTLILSVETKPELLRALEDTIQPILMFVLENAVYGSIRFMWLTIDLMSEVFEIIDSCTFSTRSISPTMWSFFPILHKAFKEYAVDYIDGKNF